MKNMFLVVLALIVSATTYTKAQQTSTHSAFLLSRSPSLSDYKVKLRALLVDRNKAGWHSKAEKYYLEYFAKKFPGKTPEQIINGTKWEKLPSGTYLSNVARISNSTGEKSLWGRYSRPGEYKGSYEGIDWTLSDCGNLKDDENVLTLVDEEPDDYVAVVPPPRRREVVETIIQQQPQIVQTQAPAPQIIYVQSQAPVQAPCPQPQQVVYTPPVQPVQYVQQPVMQQPQIQYVQQPMQQQVQYQEQGQIVVANNNGPSFWKLAGAHAVGGLVANVAGEGLNRLIYGSPNQNVFVKNIFNKNNGGGVRYDNTWPTQPTQPTFPEIYGPTNPGRGFTVATATPGLTGGGSGTTTGGGYSNGWGQ